MRDLIKDLRGQKVRILKDYQKYSLLCLKYREEINELEAKTLSLIDRKIEAENKK